MHTIRQAHDGDIAALAGLRRRWCAEKSGAPIADSGFDEQFRRWYEAESAHRTMFVAEIGPQAVGMVNLTLFERMPQPGQTGSRWGYLGNAFVVPEYRDRGIGTALLNALVAHADRLGCARIVLSPTERSVPYYERAGFGPATMLRARVRPDGIGVANPQVRPGGRR